MTSRASERAVLVTGSSSGIGEACAIELHNRGFRVFAGVRRLEDGQRLVSQTSSRLEPVILDVTDSNSIAAAKDQVEAAVGTAGLGGLVNNAGISIACPLEFIPLEKLRLQLEVNVVGQIAVTQAALSLLRAAQGRVINVSSLSGLIAGPYIGAYSASKHALEALSDALRMELRHFGIKVSVVEPAAVATPIWDKSRAMADDIRDQVMDKVGDRLPEDVQDAYRDDLAAMREKTSQLATKAIPTSRVVKAILSALEAKHPKARYLVGARVWSAFGLRYLPAAWRDAIVLRNLGMS